LEEIITSSHEVFEDVESDMAVGIRRLGNQTGETAKHNIIVTQNASSAILTGELEAK